MPFLSLNKSLKFVYFITWIWIISEYYKASAYVFLKSYKTFNHIKCFVNTLQVAIVRCWLICKHLLDGIVYFIVSSSGEWHQCIAFSFRWLFLHETDHWWLHFVFSCMNTKWIKWFKLERQFCADGVTKFLIFLYMYICVQGRSGVHASLQMVIWHCRKTIHTN